MRALWNSLGLVLLLSAGCRSTGPELKPPPQPENWSLPPKDDQRYSGYYKEPVGGPNGSPRRSVGDASPVVPVRNPRTPGQASFN